MEKANGSQSLTPIESNSRMADLKEAQLTPISLLDRLRTTRSERDWEILISVYDGLIQQWLKRAGVALEDQEDLRQEILMTLVRAVPAFQHNGRAGAFRKWLKTIVTHRILDHLRKRQTRQKRNVWNTDYDLMRELENRVLQDNWEQEHDQHVLQQLLNIVKPRFTISTWTAFRRLFFDGEPVQEISRELGISENAVLIAKSRVLRCLREEAAGIVD